MRIAERGEHAPEVGGNVLHHKGNGGVARLVRFKKNEPTEREKGQERHVVRNQHRADKGNHHQCQHGRAQGDEHLDDPTGGIGEETNVFQGADNGECAEKTGDGPKINVMQILFVGRHDNDGCKGNGKRNAKDDVMVDKGREFMKKMKKMGILSDAERMRIHEIVSVKQPSSIFGRPIWPTGYIIAQTE